MLGDISRMGPDIRNDLMAYILAPLSVILHSSSFKEIAFIKDKTFFLKGQKIFRKGWDGLFMRIG